MIRGYKKSEKGTLVQLSNSNSIYFIPLDKSKDALYIREGTKKDIVFKSNLAIYLLERNSDSIKRIEAKVK